MDLGIAGRKAIINGGSAGMGKGSARALAKEGVDIWLVARGEERLHAAAAEIARETNARVTPVVADHSTVAGRGRILDACPEPDILVMTCAPPAQTGDYRSVSVDDWNDTFATTLLSPARPSIRRKSACCRARRAPRWSTTRSPCRSGSPGTT